MSPAPTPRRRPAGEPDPVTLEGRQPDGELVALEGEVDPEPIPLVATPVFTPEQLAADRQNRVDRTAGQAFPAAMAITVLAYVLQHALSLDLDPGDGSGFPPGVEASLTGLLTWLASKWVNRTPKGI